LGEENSKIVEVAEITESWMGDWGYEESCGKEKIWGDASCCVARRDRRGKNQTYGEKRKLREQYSINSNGQSLVRPQSVKEG